MAQPGRSIGFTFYAKDMFERVSARMVQSLEKVKVGVEAVSRASMKTTSEALKTDAALRRMDTTAKQSKGASELEERWQRLGRRVAATAAGIASVATVQHMVRQAATVEDAVNQVMSLVRDPADQDAYAEKITSIIRENQRLGISVESLGTTLSEQVATLGFSEESFEAYRAAVKLSVAAFQPLESSVAAVNKLVDAFPGLKGANAAQLLFTTRQMTNDYGGLVAGLPNISPIASTAGVSPAKMLALFTVLADETKSAAAATNIESELLRTLGAKGSPKQNALLKLMAIDNSPAGLEAAGLPTQLARLRLVGQRNPAALSAVGLSEATQKALLTMSDADIQRIAKAEAAIRGDAAKGTIDQSFQRVQESTTAELAKTQQALNELSSVIGKELTPSVRTIAEVLRSANLNHGSDIDRALGIQPGEKVDLGEILRRTVKLNNQGAGGLDPGARPGKGG